MSRQVIFEIKRLSEITIVLLAGGASCIRLSSYVKRI
jgi:hypothetical protein